MLSQKRREDLKRELDIRGLDSKTKLVYTKALDLFIFYFNGKDPEQMGLEEIKLYQQHLLIDQGYAPRTVNREICGIRFFYCHVLKMWWMREEVIKVKEPDHIPVLLSEAEIAKIIDSVHSVFYKAVIMLLYSTGMRQEELRSLKTTDVDSQRMLINVRDGKNGKDRQVFLSPMMLKVLRTYWRLFRLNQEPKTDILFVPTKNSHGRLDKKLSHTAIGYMIDTAVEAAGIKKKLLPIPFAIALPSIY